MQVIQFGFCAFERCSGASSKVTYKAKHYSVMLYKRGHSDTMLAQALTTHC